MEHRRTSDVAEETEEAGVVPTHEVPVLTGVAALPRPPLADLDPVGVQYVRGRAVPARHDSVHPGRRRLVITAFHTSLSARTAAV